MSHALRLLFIVPRFGSVHRGVEAFVTELVSRMDTSRYAVTVLSGPHDSEIPGVHFQKGRLLARERLAWLDRLPWLCRLLRPLGLGGAADIETLSLLYHYRKYWSPSAFDLVVPLAGSWSYRFASKAFPEARLVGIGQAGPVPQDLALSDIFVALTPHDEQRANQMRPGMPTCIIPNGVDTGRFASVPMGASRRGRTRRVILCAAALVPDKRHDLLFNAVMRMPGHVWVKCVGAGPHRAVLAQHPLAKAGRVEFCQHTFYEMPEVYRGADVFSLASPAEAFGIVFVEAMAAGLPVVAHDGPRQRYVVDDGGLLCDVHDSQAYARALESVLDVAPSTNARTQSMKFDWRKIAAKYDKLFYSLYPGVEPVTNERSK